jgi:hypothetical protein
MTEKFEGNVNINHKDMDFKNVSFEFWNGCISYIAVGFGFSDIEPTGCS